MTRQLQVQDLVLFRIIVIFEARSEERLGHRGWWKLRHTTGGKEPLVIHQRFCWDLKIWVVGLSSAPQLNV